MSRPEDSLTPEAAAFANDQLSTLLLCALIVPPKSVLLTFDENHITAADLLRVVELVALGLGAEEVLPAAQVQAIHDKFQAMVETTRKSLQKPVSPLN